MPASISEQSACDTVATRVKAYTKTASSSLSLPKRAQAGEREGDRNLAKMRASVNTDSWCKMEMFVSLSNSRVLSPHI